MTEEEKYEESVLFARIALGEFIDYPEEGWQKRYVEGVDSVANEYRVKSRDLGKAWMSYVGPSFEEILNET